MMEKVIFDFKCFAGKIEKINDKTWKIYLFNSIEKGGDTKIIVKGEIEVFKERFKETRRGLMPDGYELVFKQNHTKKLRPNHATKTRKNSPLFY